MRTTVTLDKDVEQLVQQEMFRSQKSFKETINAALRLALGGIAGNSKIEPFIVNARALGLRGSFDSGSLNRLVDDLEVEEFLKKQTFSSNQDNP